MVFAEGEAGGLGTGGDRTEEFGHVQYLMTMQAGFVWGEGERVDGWKQPWEAAMCGGSEGRKESITDGGCF